MTIADWTALIGLLLSGTVFVLLASRAKITSFSLLGYTLADKQVTGQQYGASFVAASTSLATVILFFLSTIQTYGITLLWCGTTYLVGQYFFVRFVRNKEVIKEDVRTIADLWYYTVRSKTNSRLITALTVTSFLIILFVELYVGSIILSYFFASVTGYAKIISFLTIGIIVILYVRLGGLRAVMQTDGWQLRLLIIAVVALLLFSFISQNNNIPTIPEITSFTSDWTNVFIFWFWILVLNFTLPFTQLSSWQRVAACKSGEEVWNGFKSHIVQFLMVWFLPVIAFAILSAKGLNFGVLDDLLLALKSEGGIAEGILYPLIVIGFGSALFSTADTALIALTTSFADTNTFKKKLESLSVDKLKNLISISSFAIMIILTIIYGIAEANVGEWFMPMIYNIFGQIAIIAPLIIYSLINLESEPIHLSKTGNFIISISILLAWLLILFSTYITHISANQIWSQLATPAGMVITSLGLFLALRFKVKNNNND